jgi:Raf kinase inhibitor-like YbhB/YbcL family protein
LTDGAPEFSRTSPTPKQGLNHFQKSYYKGPCPPAGNPHHYHFKLYALDSTLNLPEGSTKHEVETAMKKHKILDQAELIGLYQH